ncbi:MAG: hypothetical protein ACRCYO_07435 [Bacteroidia bacterium]
MKANVFNACLEILNKKIQAHELSLHELIAGAANDSKSTAGDKHETARAMMQLEQEKLSKQLSELRTQKNVLEQLREARVGERVGAGSLIKTDKGILYLSIALGRITIDGATVFALSPQSPLGEKLIGKKKGDLVEMNGAKYVIAEIN